MAHLVRWVFLLNIGTVHSCVQVPELASKYGGDREAIG